MLSFKYHSNHEIKNFILWSLKPLNFLIVFNFYFKKVLEKYFKIKKNTFLEKNKYLSSKSLLEIKNFKSNKDFLIDNVTNIIPSRIRINSIYLNIDKSPNWEYNFEDEEFYFSLHRWNWLLTSISENKIIPTYEWGITMARSWISEMGIIPNTIASESYSVGERIVNFLLFSRITKNMWGALPKDINSFILKSTEYLINNLEYYGENHTGNHLFNNARALYITSKVYNLKNLEIYSKKIITERLNALITKDGFLREGSSHYHFLFTRWVFELYLISLEFRDIKFNTFLEDELKNLITKCNFFLIGNNNQLPLFGDVSPDFDPEWLIDIPILWEGIRNKNLNIKDLNGWSYIFRNAFKTNLTHVKKIYKKEVFYKFEESGWYKLDWEKWNIIWHTKTKNCKSKATHSHQDFGSFVIYYDGKELIKDIGRLNYNLKSELGLSSTFSTFHNSVLIDKMPISLFPYDSIFPNKYSDINYKFDFYHYQDSIKVVFSHDGYSRLVNKKLKHSRSFVLTKSYLNIIDDFNVKSRFEIDMYLYLNNLTEYDIKIINSKNIISKINEKKIDHWSFPRYGFKEYSKYINTNFEISSPSSITHQIKIKS